MNNRTLDLIIKCIDTNQKYFNYKKGEYVNKLLEIAFEHGWKTKSDIKESAYSFLANKAEYNKLIGKSGNGALSNKLFETSNGLPLSLTLGKWGSSDLVKKDSWYQTSTPGWNLVLQLNFDEYHELLFYNTFNAKINNYLFGRSCHPIAKKKNTMAWSRIDLCLETGEAFIEEIQNDWLRDVFDVKKDFKNKTIDWKKEYWLTGYTTIDKLENYIEYMNQYKSWWAEAMLMSTIDFIVNDLGIRKVYYHTYESGNFFKQLYSCRPPKSLYTKLPRQFGFQQVDQVPAFWTNNKYMKRCVKKYKGEFFFFDYNKKKVSIL